MASEHAPQHGEAEPIRFADVLTTASAVANYLGEPDVRADHLLAAVDILLGAKSMEDLGRPTSPLVRRPAPPGATPAVRQLVQRWFTDLGSSAAATLEGEQLDRFLRDVQELAASSDD